MAGWMTYNFVSISTVFQSFQDDERMTTKVVCNGTPFTIGGYPPPADLKRGTTKSAGQFLTYTELPPLSLSERLLFWTSHILTKMDRFRKRNKGRTIKIKQSCFISF